MNDQPERIDEEEEQAARLTALVLGELNGQVEVDLVDSQRDECDEIERVSVALLKSGRPAVLPASSAELRELIESKLSRDAVMVGLNGPATAHNSRGRWVLALSAGLLLLLFAFAGSDSLTDDHVRSLAKKFETAELQQQNAALRSSIEEANVDLSLVGQAVRRTARPELGERQWKHLEQLAQQSSNHSNGSAVSTEGVEDLRAEVRLAQMDSLQESAIATDRESYSRDSELKLLVTPRVVITDGTQEQLAKIDTTTQAGGAQYGSSQPPTYAYVTPPVAQSSPARRYSVEFEAVRGRRLLGTQGVPAPNQLAAGPTARGAGTAVYEWDRNSLVAGGVTHYRSKRGGESGLDAPQVTRLSTITPAEGVASEQYSQIVENRFASVRDEPLSTFSIDVDTASYANARRFLSQNQLPPADAIRIEEFVNYFSYDYPAPKAGEPFSVNMEVAQCPWQPEHQLVRIGLKGKEIPQQERPASNIVFLLDVSGSMQDANKLPLLKQAMKLLTDQLTESDRVSIVTYAGNAGLALDITNGESKQAIRDAIDALNANGSTNGSAGISLAYEKAAESFIKKGANRVILATDGDLNVGVTDDDALVQLIKQKAAGGVFLTVLGFGEGNLKDGKLEKLADNGNGMYAYVDSLREARKVLVEQISGSLVTIAKDVKIKVEFNPAEVTAYRLLGYENRLMSAPDFDNDAKDAGEIGAGHTVTALYEIVPAKIREQFAATGLSLKYQRTVVPAEPPKELTDAAETGELLTLFLRYKQPDANESTLSEFIVENKERAFDDASPEFRFAAAVASFGMVLRNSEYRGNSSLADVEQVASSAIGRDQQGHRTEFLDLVRKANTLQPQGR